MEDSEIKELIGSLFMLNADFVNGFNVTQLLAYLASRHYEMEADIRFYEKVLEYDKKGKSLLEES